MRDDPISRFLKRLETTSQRLGSTSSPSSPVASPMGERPRGRGFGGSFDTIDLGSSTDTWSPQREFGARPADPTAQMLPAMETRAADPSGRGLASAIAYRLDQPRRVARVSRETGMDFGEAEQQSMASFNRNRAPGEFEGGFSAGMDTAPAMAGLSVIPNVGPLKSVRRNLEEYMTTRITERAKQVAIGGGDPSSGRFMGGVITGGALPTVVASGGAIAALGTGIARTAQAAQAIRGTSAVANAIRGTGALVSRSPLTAAYAASAAVTGLTTGKDDSTLTSMVAPEFARRIGMDKGAGAAVAEDFALNVAGDLGMGGIKRLAGITRKATDGTSRLLTSEVKEQRAAEVSLDRGRQALDTYEKISGVDPTTGQPVDPTRRAVRDFWQSVRDAQNGSTPSATSVNAGVDVVPEVTPAGEKKPLQDIREILRENARRGIGYGVVGLAGAEAAREMGDNEEQSGAAPLAMAMTGLSAINMRQGAKLGGRLTKVADELGQAKVLFHGTGDGFDLTDPSRYVSGARGKGYYWTEDSKVAGGSVRGMIEDFEKNNGRNAANEGGYAGGGYHSPNRPKPPQEHFVARSEMIALDERLKNLEAQATTATPADRQTLDVVIGETRRQRDAAAARMNELWPEGLQPNVRVGRALAERVFDIDETLPLPELKGMDQVNMPEYLDEAFAANKDLSRVRQALLDTAGPAKLDDFMSDLADKIGERAAVSGDEVHTALKAVLNGTDIDANDVLKKAGYDALTLEDPGYMVDGLKHSTKRGGKDGAGARTWVFFGDETDQIRSPWGPAENAPPMVKANADSKTMRNSVATGLVAGAGAQALVDATSEGESGTTEAGMGSAVAGAVGAAAAAATAGGKTVRRVLGRVGAAIGGAAKRAPAGQPLPQRVIDALPDVTPTPYRSPARGGAAGPGNAYPYGPMNSDDYLNFENGRWQELRNDPDGKLAVQQRTQALVQERGADFRKPVTFDEVRAQADILGLDANELVAIAQKRGLDAREQLAAGDVVAQNMDNIVEYQRVIDDPATSPEIKAVTQRNLAALESQTNELLWAGLTARTEAGRNLAFQRIAARRTMDPSFWLAQAGKNLGNPDMLRADHMVEINRFIQAKDRMGLASYVAGLKPGRAQRVLTTLYKAGLLTNPATYASNIASNTLMAGAEAAKDAPASLVDRIVVGAMNAAIGSGDAIKRSRDFDARLAKASMLGAMEGAKDITPIMKGKDPGRTAAMMKYDQIEEVRLGDSPAAKLAEVYLNGPFRILRASDAPFKMSAYMRSLDQQRRIAGLPKVDTLQEMMKGITPDMAARAAADAEIATFQNKSALGTAAQGLKKGLSSLGPAGKAASEVLLPFTQTPGAVAGSVVRYSPLGLAHAGTDAVSLVAKTLKARTKASSIGALKSSGANTGQLAVEQEQLREQIKLLQELKNNMVDRAGRGMVGTTIMGLGMMMASNGMLTVKPGRTDRVQRDTGEAMGDPGNSIDFGPLNGQIDRMAPIANLLLLGAYLVKGYEAENPQQELEALQAKSERTAEDEMRLQALQNQQEEDGARLFESSYGQAIATALGSIGSVIVEQPVFSGVSRVQDALNDPLRAAKQVGYAQVGSLIPAGVAAIARTVDDRRRDTETFGETMKARLPFLSKSVPEKLDALGEPIIEPLSVRLANLVSPARLSSDRTAGNSESAMVRRLIQGENITVSRISQDKKGGETLRQARDRQRTTGDFIRQRLSGISQSDLQQMPKEMREDYLRGQISRARQQATRFSKGQRQAALFDDLSNVFNNQ